MDVDEAAAELLRPGPYRHCRLTRPEGWGYEPLASLSRRRKQTAVTVDRPPLAPPRDPHRLEMATYLDELGALRLFLHVKTLRTLEHGVGDAYVYCQIQFPRRRQDEAEVVPAWLRLLAAGPPDADCGPAHVLARRWSAELADEVPFAMPPKRGEWLARWLDRLAEPACVAV